MSNTQTMLTIASLVFLSTLILNFYRSSGTQETALLNSEAIVAATDISRGIIEEIQTRAFDEKTLTKSIQHKDSLSSVLGKDAGETVSTTFDDIDDYHNYSRIDSLPKLGNFYINVKVNYVNDLAPHLITTSKTFNKRIDVSVLNFFLTDTLRTSHIISY